MVGYYIKLQHVGYGENQPFINIEPEITRKQILKQCAHQFIEGDVEHWWHEESCRGIRTRFSDDLLWLPYAVAEYVKATSDLGILKEEVEYINGNLLKEGENEIYVREKAE